MFDKLYDHRGAVSVFLVIVLLPTILCSSLFVDASRVQSAKGLVSAAGDLTLNTVLSQYDVDLNDFYGLMASAQDMEDVKAAAEDYFTACIKSQGISTTDIARYVNSISGFFLGDDSVSDFLGLDLADNAKVSVSETENGNLANPALIKTQIVEFMKYRSPINSIVDLLSKFQDSSKELENTAKTTELVEKKQEYYEAQGEVAKRAYEIYELIVEYNKLALNKNDIEAVKNLLVGIEDKYEDIHIKMVKDLYNTSGIKDITKTFVKCKPLNEKYTPNKKNAGADAKKIGGQIYSLIASYDQFITAKNNFDNNIKAWSESYYDIQYLVYAYNNKTYFTTLFNKASNLRDSFIKLRDLVDHAEEGALEEEYTSTRTSNNLSVNKTTKKKICDWYTFLQSKVSVAIDSVAGKGKYNTAVVKLREINNVYDRISTSSTDKKLSELYSSLNDYYTRYEQAEKVLTKIVNGLTVSKPFNKCLKDLIVEADNKFATWENKANSYKNDITLASSDLKEIQEVKSDIRNEKLNTSDVDTYSQHVNNVKSAVGIVKKSLEGIKYNDTSVLDKEIYNVSQMKKYANVISSEIPMNKNDLGGIDGYAKGYADNTFVFSTDDSINRLGITDNNDPVIASRKFKVYDWMLKQDFPNPVDNKKEEAYNNDKKKADAQADAAYNEPLADVSSDKDITSENNLPSGSSGDLPKASITTKISEIGDFVGDLFTDFGGTVASAGADLRDDFFAVDYITSMFTYHTFEYESKFNMLSKDEKNKITFSNASNYYNKFDSKWNSTEVTDTFNKTLTNKMRNSPSTNWSYGNEVEYIMYGKSIKESKDALRNSIYMIRYALNIAPVFSVFYSDFDLDKMAQGVNIATHGIIPAGLVKVVICLGLVALETSKDIQTLKAGIPVILVKTGEADLFLRNWYFDAENFPKTTKITDATTFTYSDYMKLLLFIKLVGSEESDIYGRIADVIQVNMGKIVGLDNEKKPYLLSKSQVYYSIEANLTVDSLMLDTSYVASLMPDASNRMLNWNKITYKATRGY